MIIMGEKLDAIDNGYAIFSPLDNNFFCAQQPYWAGCFIPDSCACRASWGRGEEGSSRTSRSCCRRCLATYISGQPTFSIVEMKMEQNGAGHYNGHLVFDQTIQIILWTITNTLSYDIIFIVSIKVFIFVYEKFRKLAPNNSTKWPATGWSFMSYL